MTLLNVVRACERLESLPLPDPTRQPVNLFLDEHVLRDQSRHQPLARWLPGVLGQAPEPAIGPVDGAVRPVEPSTRAASRGPRPSSPQPRIASCLAAGPA